MEALIDILVIEQKVRKLIESQLNIELTDKMMSSNIKTELGVDSLDEVFVIEMIEKLFHIRITDDDADEFKTINDIVQFVKKETYYQNVLLNLN